MPRRSAKDTRFEHVGKNLQDIIAHFPVERLRSEDDIALEEMNREQQMKFDRIPHLAEAFKKGLPKEYQEMLTLELPKRSGLKEARKVAASLRPGEHLFIYGTPGNYKTHLAVRTAQHLIQTHSLSARYWSWPGYLTQMRNFADTEFRPDILAPDILIMDELDKGGDTDWVYEQLYELLMRQVHQKTIIGLANHDPSETALMYGRSDDPNREALMSRFSRFIPALVTGNDDRPNRRRLP